MNNYKATDDQWEADRYDWSKAGSEAMTGDSAFRCILELRSRIEQLEAQANRIPEAIHCAIEAMPPVAEPAPVAGEVEELVADLRTMATDAGLACQPGDFKILTRAANLLQQIGEQEAGR